MNKLNKYMLALVFASCISLLVAQSSKENLYIDRLLERTKILESSNLDSAGKYVQEALSLSKKEQYKIGISKSFFRLAYQFFMLGKKDSARIFVSKALVLSKQLEDHKTIGSEYKLLGSLYQAAGKKDSAYFAFYHSLEIFEIEHDSLNMCRVYNALAEISFNYGETKTALSYLAKAESILSRINDISILASTYHMYANIYYYTDNFEKSIKYGIRAKTLNDSLKRERFVADGWALLGLCYEAMDNDVSARTCFNHALKYYLLHRLPDEVGETYFNIGIFFYNRDKNDSAIFYFEKSLTFLESAGDTKVKLRVLPWLSEAYAFKGNYLKAYLTHVRYFRLNDSLLNKEKIKQIAEMQTKYETEKQNQEIKLLNEQHKSKIAQRNFFIAGSVVLFLVLLVLGFYYIQRSRIAKQNEQIAQEKISGLLKEQEIKSYDAMIEGQEEERKRIATDLHDRLGSMLSTVKILFGNLNEKIDVNQSDNQKQYKKASNLLDEAVLEVRRIAQNLSTGMVITFGLIPALEELCGSISESKILKCKFLCYGIEERMEQHIEIGIFRMMQEIVNNVLKHSKAKHLTIQMNRTEDSITVTVEDDGLGFNIQEKNNGMGLKNLEARAYKMGGTYNIDSKPGHGTISIIEIPLKNDTNLNS